MFNPYPYHCDRGAGSSNSAAATFSRGRRRPKDPVCASQRRTPPCPAFRWVYAIAFVGVFCAALFGQSKTRAPFAMAGGDVMRGWRVFHVKGCADCHAIWDEGGHVGPDLGRIRINRLSEAQLAGVMWNHIPTMLGRMRQGGQMPAALTRDEMGDLFALLFFVRQLDEPGDPVRGKETLRVKGCSECHDTDSAGQSVGPDLATWSRYANPILWAQLMWEHAPMMEEAMKRNDIVWPKLEGSDLIHIVAYVRSRGAGGRKIYLSPGSVANGEALFKEKHCSSCHPGVGPDLTTTQLPLSVGAVASLMWNHSPTMMQAMRERNVAREPLSAQELADVVAYVLALGSVDPAGDPARGSQVFARKGCVQCHEREELSQIGAPPLTKLGASSTPIDMATVMWNHGETMLDRMAEAGISWPVFVDDEMVDLLAYLKAVNVKDQE